ncbi:MAG: AEC family transporter [Anaerolineaceae bacterium]|nr:AEC family transporter [Anaerolineaceae bacterium]
MGFELLLKFQAVTFIALAFGLVFRRLGLLPAKTADVLGDLIINLALPCSILTSFMVKPDSSLLRQFVIAVFIAALTQVLAAVVNRFAYQYAEPEHQKNLKYPTYVSNSGFLGTVIAGGMYPEHGVMMAAITTIPLRIVMWSVALSLFTPAKNPREAITRVALHPCMIAVYLGLILLFSGYHPPDLINEALNSIGKTATPLSMILVGCLVAEISDLRTFFDRDVLWFSLIRLVLIPGLVYAGCKLFGVAGITRGVSVILAAMPAAVTTAVLASKYKSDTAFATKIVVTSTLLSLISLPIWELILLR